MMRRIVLPILLLAATAAVATGSGRSKRCKIPVFRYALERWRATPYEAILFYRGKLGKKDLETIEVLKDSFPANVYVESVDLSSKKIPEDLRGIWAAQGDATLPSLVVLYPPHPSQPLDAPAAWRGTPGPEIARTIVDSPVRREISKRILEGESAVWLLIESGDKAADDAAVKLLKRELKDLEETLDVPALQELEEDPGSPALIAEVPLRLAFSVLRVNREDPAEKMFVGMIFNADADLEKEKGPIALPIIGRGRALWPLYGEELNDDQIFRAADFLVGACSCQVKELNPGMDLIFKTDWERVLSGYPLEEPAPIVEGPVKVAIPPGTVAADVPVPQPAPVPLILLLFLLLVAVVGGWIYIRIARQNPVQKPNDLSEELEKLAKENPHFEASVNYLSGLLGMTPEDLAANSRVLSKQEVDQHFSAADSARKNRDRWRRKRIKALSAVARNSGLDCPGCGNHSKDYRTMELFFICRQCGCSVWPEDIPGEELPPEIP